MLISTRAITAIKCLEIITNISTNVGLLFFGSVSLHGFTRFLKCLKPQKNREGTHGTTKIQARHQVF